MRTRKPPPDEAALVRFSDLPVFRLDVLNSITSKHGELMYERLFGMRTLECRVLGVVRAYPPASLRRVCVELGIDKSQASRVVAKAVENGWMERHDDPEDQRSFFLLLTPAGHALHARINAAALKRSQQWISGLPEELCTVFLECLERQIRHARTMLAQETKLSSRPPQPTPSHELPDADLRDDRPLLVKRERLQAMYHELGALLGVEKGEPEKGRPA